MSFSGAGMLLSQFLADIGGKVFPRREGRPPWILNQKFHFEGWKCIFNFVLLVSSSQKPKLPCLVGILL